MTQLGDYAANAALNFKFNTDINGVPITLAGGAISVWKQGSSTPITAGVTFTADYQSVTGLHDVVIDLSASASYVAGKDYQVYLSSGTVGGVSQVGVLQAEFSIEHRTAAVIMTTAMTESYNSDGAAPTPTQALMLLLQRLTEFSISGTIITIKKLDGATTAATLTLDSATDPTSTTRAT